MRRRAWGRTAAAADRQALDVALSCKKNQKEEGGSARDSPVAALIVCRPCVVGPGVGLLLLLIGRL